MICAYGYNDMEKALISRINRPSNFDVHMSFYGDLPIVEMIDRWRPVGVIAYLDVGWNDKGIFKTGLPFVNCGTLHAEELQYFAQFPHVANVCVDESTVARAGANHLLELGVRHFGFVTHEGRAFSNQRCEHFVSILAGRGIPVDICRREYGGPAVLSFFKFLQNLEDFVRRIPKPAGVMAADDYLGYEIIRACNRVGVRIPDELAVIGVNDMDLFCNAVTPMLSSVALPYDAWASTIWKTMQRMVDGETVGNSPQLLPVTRVIVRGSSQVSSRNDPQVAAALEFIRNNASIRLSVEQVAQHVMLSRRVLERRFKEFAGRTILQEIHAQRIAWEKELLANTSLKISAVALRAGYLDHRKFCRFFKGLTGMTPWQYRQSLKREEGNQSELILNRNSKDLKLGPLPATVIPPYRKKSQNATQTS